MQPRRAPLFANSSARHVPWPSTCSLQPAGAQNPALQTQQCSRSAQAALRSALPLAGVQTAALLPRQAGNVASCKFSSFLEPLNRWPAARLVICYLLVSLSIFFFSPSEFQAGKWSQAEERGSAIHPEHQQTWALTSAAVGIESRLPALQLLHSALLHRDGTTLGWRPGFGRQCPVLVASVSPASGD